MKHILEVLGSIVYNVSTHREECTTQLEVSEDVINWLEMHDVKIDAQGRKIYVCNQVEYRYLGPKFEKIARVSILDLFREEEFFNLGGLMKQILIYDISSCPMSAGLSMEEVLRIYKEHDTVLYDSQENTEFRIAPVKEPKVLNIPEGNEIKVLDYSNEEHSQQIKELENGTKE
tara:strand:- start:51 stop:572 length:522 start_codon:yes stop_codon:yes gene_type:complete